MEGNESRATAKFQRVSPRKTRIIAKVIIGQPVQEALDTLKFIPNKPAEVLYKVVKSATANGMQADADPERLCVKEVVVNDGPAWKRFMPRAQGRATKIHKRTSHITVILAEGQE